MLSLKDFIRLSSQHRTIYCYLLLWILLIIFGMYKYVSSEAGMQNFILKPHQTSSYINSKRFLAQQDSSQNQNNQRRYCNSIENLVQAEEGGVIEGWTLQGKIHYENSLFC
jgi:2-phosphoxylose phosphatase